MEHLKFSEMDIVKAAVIWAKDEEVSTLFFIIFGMAFIAGSLGFWQLGKTETARAFIYPTLVAGLFLLVVGGGLFFSNRTRLANLENDYNKNSMEFVQSEIKRTEQTMKEYKNVALKVFPVVIAIAALLLVFVHSPIWRAICITMISMLVIIILVDINANARITKYYKQLKSVENQF